MEKSLCHFKILTTVYLNVYILKAVNVITIAIILSLKAKM